MTPLLNNQLIRLADATTVSNAMHGVVSPLVSIVAGLASAACAFFLIVAGFHYMTSSGQPERLAHAKHLIRNALLGLVIVMSAVVLTALLAHAYGSPGSAPPEQLPSLTAVQPASTSLSLIDVLVKAVTGLLQNIVQSVSAPIISALQYFTASTPLMAENGSVFNLWLAITAIADALFVLFVALLGLNIMSSASFGLEEIEFKHLLPQLGLIFLMINSSIFVIDTVISISNGLITALNAGFGDISVWQALSGIIQQSSAMGLAALLIMLVFVVLAVMLLVYYVGRLVTLYLGAVLSPLVFLLWLLPSFKDFASNAGKTYLTTIFVLFVHVVILELAASIFASLSASSPNNTPDPIMSLIVGLSTLIALIKTQGVLMQLSYASVGPKALRRLGGLFVNSAAGALGREAA